MINVCIDFRFYWELLYCSVFWKDGEMVLTFSWRVFEIRKSYALLTKYASNVHRYAKKKKKNVWNHFDLSLLFTSCKRLGNFSASSDFFFINRKTISDVRKEARTGYGVNPPLRRSYFFFRKISDIQTAVSYCPHYALKETKRHWRHKKKRRNVNI